MEVVKNKVYKHYKGDSYLVEDIVINSETDEEMVLYRALYGEGLRFVRPKSAFIELLDKSICTDSNQQYRYELQDIKSKNHKY